MYEGKRITVLDGEWTVTKGEDNKKIDGRPYNPENTLVSIGVNSANVSKYLFFHHKKNPPSTNIILANKKYLQAVLDKTDVLVGHNLKADLAWLWECGFTYDGEIWDTMVYEYIQAKGLKKPLNLKACLIRRGLNPKTDVLIKYMKQGFNVDEIPSYELKDYGLNDIHTTKDLFELQIAEFESDPFAKSTSKALVLMNEFCVMLTQMERDGVYIDLERLEQVRVEFEQEHKKLHDRLYEIVFDVMGHTPVNLASPEQLSWVMYSRKVKDKAKWKQIFNLGTEERNSVTKKKYTKIYSESAFRDIIRLETIKLQKTEAVQCEICLGKGKVQELKKDGNNKKKLTNCKACSSQGFIYYDLPSYAGLKLKPISSKYAATGGFATGKLVLDELLKQPKLTDVQREFLKSLKRYNAISTYLESFVGGIQRASIKLDDNKENAAILHMSYSQTTTATGRLSSTFHNLPRGNTFPIKRVVRSRWHKEGGKIIDCDLGQIEFRAAAIMSGDPVMIQDILDLMDIHSFTAKVLTEAGQITDRQTAKTHTFKPLYGGVSGTEAEMAYYRAFKERYKVFTQWQLDNAEGALHNGYIQSPSGRIYAFPNLRRVKNGSISSFPQLCNYKVQGFATGDITPTIMLELWKEFKLAKLESKIIITTHDSITADVHPNEIEQVKQIFKQVFDKADKLVEARFGIVCPVPLTYDLQIGDDWLNKVKVAA